MNKKERVLHIQKLLKNVRKEYSEVEIGCGSKLRTSKDKMPPCIGCTLDVADHELRKLLQEFDAMTEPLFND